MGAPCDQPPIPHSPDTDCSPDCMINQSPVVEMKTRRTYFLDMLSARGGKIQQLP